ncbi:unnamed protein product [Prorocentrum cordatum]|uniref:Gustatory receptor n=1 Tax=Prorocentrum cordatum TaxID=2364126 RepID=A0ABN9XAC3_9DINO|nr:unnamed protein product [Polarella glacialis]
MLSRLDLPTIYLSVRFLCQHLCIRHSTSGHGSFPARVPPCCFLQKLYDRGFPWENLRISALLAWCVPLVAVMLRGMFQMRQAMSVVDDSRTAFRAIIFLQMPMECIFMFVCFGIHALVFVASKLHEHDLMRYAGAVVKAMPRSDSDVIVPSLRKLEFTVSARLRYASTTWVRFTVLEILLFGILALVACTRLLLSETTSFTSGWSMILILASSLVVVLSAPLASVAETFEYDVLRALNNPSVLKQAQQHFGQQLLAHLQTLDWGFRVGGTVINNKMVVQVATALVITSVTAVSQSFITISQ